MAAISDPIHVIINPISAQFEAIQRSETVGILAYERAGKHIDLRHTFVPPKQRGKGVAGVLVAGALDAIRRSGGTVTPSCSYVNTFVHDHAEYRDLRATEPFPTRPDPVNEPPRLHVITGDSLVDIVDVQVDRIVSNRLIMRPWTLDDTDSALAIYGDEAVTRWTRPFIDRVDDRNSMRRRLDDWITQSNRLPHPQGRWAIELGDSGALVGGAALLSMPIEGDSRVVMSWELAPSAVGHGLAAEAGHALIHYAFKVSATPAVHALVQSANDRGIATLQRVGMIRTPGVQHHRGTDLQLYAIARDDLDLNAARRSLSVTD
jgi:RimJ/RimL family protein N-acetyltransferase/predicted GNAT family acetyltransferase